MIAACTVIKDEVDVIDASVRHILSQGVDHVWVSDCQSTDGTREVLAEIDEVTVIDTPIPFYWAYQGDYIVSAANLAHEAGADWIIPFDADEWWTGTDGRTIAQALSTCSAPQASAEIWQYLDFDHRQMVPYPWTKISFRWRRGVYLWAGNHGVNGVEGPIVDGLLRVHELKFRGYDHYIEKCLDKFKVWWDPAHQFQPGANGAALVVNGEDRVIEPTDKLMEDLNAAWGAISGAVTISTPIPSEFRPS